MNTQRPLVWQVGWMKDPSQEPETWISAQVPGAVQLDWAKAQGWGDPHFADQWKEYLWMEDVFWLYRTILELPGLPDGAKCFFISEGIDYRFHVRLNGMCIHEQEGMFTPVKLDLTGRAKDGDCLEILVFPVPKSVLEPADRSQANQSCKPAVSYGWDFHPRLIPSGIWRDTYLEIRQENHIVEAEIEYSLKSDLQYVDVTLKLVLSQGVPSRIRWQLRDPDGKECSEMKERCDHEQMVLKTGIQTPRLWWPHDQGSPHLYTSVVELLDGTGAVTDIRITKVGFRQVRLVMHPGAWDEPENNAFPKSRSNPPITLEINGRRIFCKGSNWVCPDIFPGLLTQDRYRTLLTLARDANMNLIRNWGGAIVPHEWFHQICDELGLMVWQEFPLSCNCYEGTPEYLSVLDQESKSIVKKLRHHPCLILWCGGNELFNGWSGMTDQDLALRLLNRNCYDLDPSRPFLMTSPVMGMGHGHYVFRDSGGNEVFQIFPRASCTAYTEFGCPGPSDEDTLRSIIPEDDLFPPKPGTAWQTHHAFAAWAPNSHLLLDVIEDYFGTCGSLAELVHNGQLLQGEGLKSIFEEARRQKPRASMALNWCFIEPWPTAANLSLINWPAHPKKAYHEVAQSCRPILASARIPKFRWEGGDIFTIDLFLLNDSPIPVENGRIEAWLNVGDVAQMILAWDHPGTDANCNLTGPTARWVLPDSLSSRLLLELRVPGCPEWNSRYELVGQPVKKNDDQGVRPLNM